MKDVSFRKLAATLALALATVVGGSFAGDGGLRVEAACSISSSLRLGSGGAQVQCLQIDAERPRLQLRPCRRPVRPGDLPCRRPLPAGQATVRRRNRRAPDRDGVGDLGCCCRPRRATSGGGTSPRRHRRPVGAATAGCAINAALRRGSSGAQVRCLQSRLTALGYPVGPVDGAFGNMTHNGVVRYQRAKGLLADGIVGRITGTSLGHLGHGGERRRIDGRAGRWPAVRSAGRYPGGGPSGRRRQLVGEPRRRRPARVQRWALDLRADGHARPRRPQRRARPGQPAIRRRHDTRWCLRAWGR